MMLKPLRSLEMQPKSRRFGKRGLALVEVVVALALLGVLVALLIPMADRQRRLARLGEDLASFRQIAAWTSTYTSDFNDQFWHFSWRPGTQPWSANDPFATGLTPVTGTTLADQNSMFRAQLSYLTRIALSNPQLPNLQSGAPNLSPSVFYSHLPLLAHVGAAMPGREFISAGDSRRAWAEDPAGFSSGLYMQLTSPAEYRFAFLQQRSPWSAWWDRSPAGSRFFWQNSGTFALATNTGPFAGRSVSDVLWPSHKVMLSERYAWHYSSYPWPTFSARARAPFLFADGHVSVRTSASGNAGGDPNSGALQLLVYGQAIVGDPPAPSGFATFGDFPRFMQTINGIRGRDFGAPQPAWVP